MHPAIIITHFRHLGGEGKMWTNTLFNDDRTMDFLYHSAPIVLLCTTWCRQFVKHTTLMIHFAPPFFNALPHVWMSLNPKKGGSPPLCSLSWRGGGQCCPSFSCYLDLIILYFLHLADMLIPCLVSVFKVNNWYKLRTKPKHYKLFIIYLNKFYHFWWSDLTCRCSKCRRRWTTRKTQIFSCLQKTRPSLQPNQQQ